MDQYLALKRTPIIFPESAEAFKRELVRFVAESRAMIADYPSTKECVLKTAAGIAVDLRSYLIEWKLKKLITETEIYLASEELLKFVSENGGEEYATAAREEIKDIKESATYRLMMKSMTENGATLLGHDYASGITWSLRRGARWMTNNPCKVQLFKKDYPDCYKAYVADINRENPNAPEHIKAALMFTKVCAFNARALYPIFEATNGEFGFVCMQVDPRKISDSEAMIEQARFWNEAMKKELHTEQANIVFKLPAVEAALPVVEQLLSEGYRLCMTLDFTVAQHQSFAKLLSKDSKRHFLVLMGGLLDDKVALELESKGVEDAKLVARHCSEAVIRKSYRLLEDAGIKNISIMTAAVRGPWHVKNSIAPGGNTPILITTLPAKMKEYDREPDFGTHIYEPVEDKYLDILKTSEVFMKAYTMPEEGLLTWENLFEYPPFVAFYTEFTAAYQEIEDDFR